MQLPLLTNICADLGKNTFMERFGKGRGPKEEKNGNKFGGGEGVSEGSKKPNCFFGKVFFQ